MPDGVVAVPVAVGPVPVIKRWNISAFQKNVVAYVGGDIGGLLLVGQLWGGEMGYERGASLNRDREDK